VECKQNVAVAVERCGLAGVLGRGGVCPWAIEVLALLAMVRITVVKAITSHPEVIHLVV
jgi:hypothetical protein